MAFIVATPYMNLQLPIPTQQLGPQWALDINNAMGVIDGHTHQPGKGQPVPTSGLNINADLSFNQNNATNLRSTLYANNGSPLSLPSDICNVYVSGGNLWYNNSLGQQIQLTAGSAINVSSTGTIGGDYGSSGVPAIVDYFVSPAHTYYFFQDTNTYAPIAGGPLTISGTTANAKGITLSAPVSLSANYALELPTALPSGSNAFLVSDASGNMSFLPQVLGSTIASSTITGSNITPSTLTVDLLAPMSAQSPGTLGNIGISSGLGNFSAAPSSSDIQTCTLTSAGRPIRVEIQADGSANLSTFGIENTGGSTNRLTGVFAFFRNGSQIATFDYDYQINSGGFPISSFITEGSFPTFLDFNAPAGTNTYSIRFINGTSGIICIMGWLILLAYEI